MSAQSSHAPRNSSLGYAEFSGYRQLAHPSRLQWRNVGHFYGNALLSLQGVLFGPCRPSTIGRFVVAIGIVTFDGEARRASAHVPKERKKVITPTVAYRDSTATVESVVARRGSEATGFHASPDRVFALEVFLGDDCSKLPVSAGAVFPLGATATLSIATRQILSHLDCGGSTVAPAQPVSALLDVLSPRNHNQVTEPLADQVLSGRKWHTQFYGGGYRCTSGKVARCPAP